MQNTSNLDCMANRNEDITKEYIIDNLGDFLAKLKPLNMNKRTSLSPFTLGFFKWWVKHFKINTEAFEAQCERDLDKNWSKYITDRNKIPDCLRQRDICRELLNVDCTWVPRNSGPYYNGPFTKKQFFPKINPNQSYIYLAVEHAEDNSIILEDSNLGSVLTAIRKLGYIKSLFKIVIYKPFKGEKKKNEEKIKEQLNLIQKEIIRIGLNQEKKENWLIVMLFNPKIRGVINNNDLILRGYALDNTGEVINKDEDSKNYHEYKITGFYA